MKKQLLILIALSFLVFYSCKNNSTSPDQSNEMQADETFYPIANYIQSQLIYIDSMPLAVLKYKTFQNITDTSIVEKNDFKNIAEKFMMPDIGSPELKPQYEEDSFIDATLGTITLTYSAKNDSAEIRKADILLKQENSEVRTIYIEKRVQEKDSFVTQKMLWSDKRSCQIITLLQKKGQPEEILIEKYVWDNKE